MSDKSARLQALLIDLSAVVQCTFGRSSSFSGASPYQVWGHSAESTKRRPRKRGSAPQRPLRAYLAPPHKGLAHSR